MRCKLCANEKISIIYDGVIRNGGLGKYTQNNVPIYQCEGCRVIWHEKLFSDMATYYESEKYREELEGTADEEQFYDLHDKETLDKLSYTGTDIFRHKIVADIGCGCGAFLDYLSGVAKIIIAVEPSESYRKILSRKGFRVYAYAEETLNNYGGGVDVVTSFDVIEHVEDPTVFMDNIYKLLSVGGRAIIGTPTDAPIMRTLLGEVYERKLLFSTQHLWIFSEHNLRTLAENAGFSKIGIKYFQRYGIGNMLGWIRDKKPGTNITDVFISETLDGVWKGQCSDRGLADYIVLYVEK